MPLSTTGNVSESQQDGDKPGWKSRFIRVRRNPVVQWFLGPAAPQLCAVCLTYLLASWIGLWLGSTAAQADVIWPANGFLLGVVLLSPQKRWPGYLLCGGAVTLFMHLTYGFPPAQSLPFTVANMVEVLVAAMLMRRRHDEHPDLSRLDTLARFLVYAVIVAPLASSLVVGVGEELAGVHPGFIGLRDWGIGDALGIAIVTPLVLAIRQRELQKSLARGKRLETALLLAGMAAFSVLIFRQTSLPIAFVLIPALLLIIFRLGSSGGAIGVVLLAAPAAYFTVLGRGPFSLLPGGSLIVSILTLQFFLCVLTITVYVVGAAWAEAQRMQDALIWLNRNLAIHDGLTGLPNRLVLNDRLELAMARAKLHEDKIGVAMIDLRNFKRINESLGHPAGDEILDIIAQRLKVSIHDSDTVARVGGDEFAVIVSGLSDAIEGDRVAERLLAAIAAPIAIGSHEVSVTASMGFCLEFENEDVLARMKNAEVALHHAQAEGMNRACIYSPAMGHATIERLQLESQLRAAIQFHEFRLHYQPQFSIKDGQVAGVEALLRWAPKGGGLILPGDFISLAEEIGLIVPIGEWAIRTACTEGTRLRKLLNRDCVMAVNISPRQFQDKDLYCAIEAALQASSFPASCLELEITEGVLMHNSEHVRHTLHRIRSLGVRIAIDDFGTGFSSLSYITRFPIDRIKIDESFIHNITTDNGSRAVVSAIIAIAHGLGIRAMAEGIETKEQLDSLREMGCDEAQGYYLSRPLEAFKLKSFLSHPNPEA